MKRVHIEPGAFVDSAGRQVILRGITVFGPGINPDITAFPDKKAVAGYAENGFNAVRLALVWDRAEHETGIYDDGYLRQAVSFVEACRNAGIYVYIVLWQRHFASFRDGGCGAPVWAADTDAIPYSRLRYNASQLGYFLNPAVSRAFDNFWRNSPIAEKGVQDRYADMVRHILPFFAGRENFLGIDFMSDPYPGTPAVRIMKSAVSEGLKQARKNPGISKTALFRTYFRSRSSYGIFNFINDEKLFAEIADRGRAASVAFDTGAYSRFLSRMTDAVRSDYPDLGIFAENNYCSNIGVPGRVLCGRGTALAVNGFDIINGTTAGDVPEGAERLRLIFRRHAESAAYSASPVIVGSWGRYQGYDLSRKCIKEQLEIFDEYCWSALYLSEDGTLTQELSELLRRAYPMAVTGRITGFGYTDENTFTLTYSQKKAGRGRTIIYLPREVKRIECGGEYEINGNRLEITTGIGVHTVKIIFTEKEITL